MEAFSSSILNVLTILVKSFLQILKNYSLFKKNHITKMVKRVILLRDKKGFGGITLLKLFTSALSQKEKSLKELYTLITEHGPISKSHLIKYTGMKQTTCTRLIDELLEAGLIVENGYGESSGGRKPVMYEIKEDAYYV